MERGWGFVGSQDRRDTPSGDTGLGVCTGGRPLAVLFRRDPRRVTAAATDRRDTVTNSDDDRVEGSFGSSGLAGGHNLRTMGMDVVLLGDFRVAVDGRDVTPRSHKARAVLASLAIRHGRAVAADTLLEELWPDLRPDRSRHVLHVRVAEIRRLLKSAGASAALESSAVGYRLAVPAEALDAERFTALVGRAELQSRSGDHVGASTMLREALGLWRGDALGGVQSSRMLESRAAELEELRLTATEERVAAELADGCHQRLVGELETLVATHPLREKLWEQLVLALYRSGRQTEALRACTSLRDHLQEQAGLLPSPPMQELETAVLAHDPSLGPPPSVTLPSLAGSTPTGSTPAIDPHGAPSADGRRRPTAPPVRYTTSPDGVHIAYQISGAGPDLVVVPGFVSHLDAWWSPWGARVAERLSSFARLILFDKRGMGLSDRPPRVGLEQWLEDIELVLDAAGSEQAVVLGVSAGGAAATLFTARHPERVRCLILYGARARYIRADDYPFGLRPERVEAILADVAARWGQGDNFQVMCPSAAGDAVLRKEFERFERICASPAAGAAYLRALFEMDVRDQLPLISVPTLVVHATGDRTDSIEQARYMAERLPHATMVELDSDDHLIWMSDAREQIVDAVEDLVMQHATPVDAQQPRE